MSIPSLHQRTAETPSPHVNALRNNPLVDNTMDICEAVIAPIGNRDANLNSATAHQRTVESPRPHGYSLRNNPLVDNTMDICEAVIALI